MQASALTTSTVASILVLSSLSLGSSGAAFLRFASLRQVKLLMEEVPKPSPRLKQMILFWYLLY